MIVLLLTTLLVSLSSEFIVDSQTNIRYLRKFDNSLQAKYLAKTGMKIAEMILKADKSGVTPTMLTGKKTSKNIDSYNDIWALNFPEIETDVGTLKLQISDEQSKINISSLANDFSDPTKYYRIAQQFFLNMGLSMDFTDVIVDWVDIDDSRFSYGAESDYYTGLTPPYSAKNAPMDSINELLMVKGITPEIYYGLGGGNFGREENLVEHNRGDNKIDLSNIEGILLGLDKSEEEKELRKIGKEKSRKLSDYLRVNGHRDFTNYQNRININTASYRIISALTEKMTDDIVTEIINKRIDQPFNSVSEISKYIDDPDLRNKYLTVKSSIFKIVSTGKVKETTVKIVTIYNRDYRRYYYWSEE
ncbi:general secretion pathway protein GspK [Spirochaetota bacterium]